MFTAVEHWFEVGRTDSWSDVFRSFVLISPQLPFNVCSPKPQRASSSALSYSSSETTLEVWKPHRFIWGRRHLRKYKNQVLLWLQTTALCSSVFPQICFWPDNILISFVLRAKPKYWTNPAWNRDDPQCRLSFDQTSGCCTLIIFTNHKQKRTSLLFCPSEMSLAKTLESANF